MGYRQDDISGGPNRYCTCRHVGPSDQGVGDLGVKGRDTDKLHGAIEISHDKNKRRFISICPLTPRPRTHLAKLPIRVIAMNAPIYPGPTCPSGNT